MDDLKVPPQPRQYRSQSVGNTVKPISFVIEEVHYRTDDVPTICTKCGHATQCIRSGSAKI